MTENMNESWRSQSFRQSVRSKIEEAIRQAGNPTSKSVAEMENHVFQKARNKEEYLGYVARVILHVRDMNSKKAGHQGLLAGQVNPGSVGQGSDPMSALRNLAGQGSSSPIVGTGPVPSPHQITPIMVSGISGGGPNPGQAPHMGNINQPGMMQASNMPGVNQQGMNNLIAQQRFSQHQQQQQVQQIQQQLQHPQHQGPPQPPLQQQQPGQPQYPGHLQRPQMMVPQNAQLQVQRLRQQGPQQGPESPMPSMQPSPLGYSNPVSQPSFQCQSPGIPMVNQGPNSNQPGSSPAHQMSNVPNVLTPGYASSPSQIAPSPVSAFQGRGSVAGVPSPGSALNTPAGSMMSISSPASRPTQEDHLYLEKLKQLQKFVEPLRRMIMKIDKDEDKKKEQSRLKGLLDILTDPNKRCPIDTLLKCEQVLERMELKGKAGINQPIMPTNLPVKPQEQNICQPLLDAIANRIRSPVINHTLQRTFGPVIAALCGPSPRVPSPPPKHRKIEEDPSEIADVLQGEIARLDQRFKVQMDPVQHSSSKTVHLICQLDDKNLPCVPPINITVPENYPDYPPKCHIDKDEYESTLFLKSIKDRFLSHTNSMSQRTSITSFLDTWEMSVRQACAPMAKTATFPTITSSS